MHKLGLRSQDCPTTEAALVTAQELQSTIYIDHVAKLHHQFEQSPYKDNPDVAHLE